MNRSPESHPIVYPGHVFHLHPIRAAIVLPVFIATLWAVGPTSVAAQTLRDGLVAYWPMSESPAPPEGSTTHDLYVGNDMTVVGAPASVPGKVGSTFQFPSSAFLKVAHPASSGDRGLPIWKAERYTIAFYVKATAAPNRFLFASGSTTSNTPIHILQTGVAAAEKLDAIIRDNSNNALVNHAVTATTVFDDTWHHVAFVDDRGQVTIYIDGVADANSALFNYTYTTGALTLNTTAIGALVRTTATANFDIGLIDEVAVWSRALSQAEVDTARTDGIPLPIGPASDPANGEGWISNPAFTDEFDGTALDAGKWIDYHSYWGGRAPSRFARQNVSVSGGLLRLKTINHNLLRNGSFEDGSLAPWVVSPPTANATLFSGQINNQNPEVYRSWLYSLKMVDAGEVSQTISGLSPNTRYKLAGYGYRASGTPTLRVGVRGYGGSELSTSIAATAYPPNYTPPQVYHEFVTGDEATSAVVFVSVTGSGTAYVDELSVTLKTLPNGFVLDQDSCITAACVGTPSTDPGNKNGPGPASYGYYESRMKVAYANHASSFWLQGGGLPLGYTEIDIHEIIGKNRHHPERDTQIPTNIRYYPDGWETVTDWGYTHQTNERLADAFHVFGVDWREDTIQFYYDGQLIRTWENKNAQGETIVDQNQFIFFDTEIFSWQGLPEDDMDSEFQVDYIRAWQKPDSPSSVKGPWMSHCE